MSFTKLLFIVLFFSLISFKQEKSPDRLEKRHFKNSCKSLNIKLDELRVHSENKIGFKVIKTAILNFSTTRKTNQYYTNRLEGLSNSIAYNNLELFKDYEIDRIDILINHKDDTLEDIHSTGYLDLMNNFVFNTEVILKINLDFTEEYTDFLIDKKHISPDEINQFIKELTSLKKMNKVKKIEVYDTYMVDLLKNDRELRVRLFDLIIYGEMSEERVGFYFDNKSKKLVHFEKIKIIE